MAFRSPSRTPEQLIKSRNAALKLKHGSPQFRDVLRQRCRNRVKENRQKFLDLLRSPSGEELCQVLSDTIHEELMIVSHIKETNFEITNDAYIDAQLEYLLDHSKESDVSEKYGIEICDAEVDQIMESYDALVASDLNITQSLLEDGFVDIVECPVCDNGHLILTEYEILCSNCNVQVFAQTNLVELRSKVYCCITTHSTSCINKLSFSCEENSLKASCSHCLYHAELYFKS